jgi:hypothetical protein
MNIKNLIKSKLRRKPMSTIIKIICELKTVEYTVENFRKEIKNMIEFVINEKEYNKDDLTSLMIMEDLTGIFKNPIVPIEALRIINDELTTIQTKIVAGFNCPNCNSDNSETYILTRKQYCLDCGTNWKLNKTIAKELKKEWKRHNK